MSDTKQKIERVVLEMIRLDNLSVAELIHEVFEDGATDNPLVFALVRRLDRNWADRYDSEGEPLPETGLKPFPKPTTASCSNEKTKKVSG